MADTPLTVSAAIDSVVSSLGDGASPGGEPGSAPAPGSTAGAPAETAGSAVQSPSSGSTDRPTRPAGDDDDPEVRDNTVWSDLNKRRQVLANRSAKERERYRKDLESNLGFSLEDANAVENWKRFTTDRYNYIATYYPHFLSTWVQQTRGNAPAAPPVAGSAEPPAPVAPFSMPTPGLRSEDGRFAYDADQVNGFVDHLAHQLAELRQQNAHLQSRLDPLQSQYDLLEQERIRAQAQTYAEETYRDVSQWEGFNEVKGRMLELMASDGRVTVESAYNRAMREIYLPQSESRIREKVLTELKTRPVVPKGPTPGSGPRTSGTDPRKGMSVKDALDAVLAR